MEKESERQPKKATKGTKKRRKSSNNGPYASGSAMITADSEVAANAKQPRHRIKARKDCKRNSLSSDEQNLQTPADENGTQGLGGQNDTGVASTTNMSQNSMPNQSSHALAQQYSQTPNAPATSLVHQYRPYGNGPTVQNQIMDGNDSQPSSTMNGPPPQTYNAENYSSGYGTYGSSTQYGPHAGKPGIRPAYPGQPRYNGPPSGATPTLNQLLTTPSRYPAQGNYPNYPGGQMDYNQGNNMAGTGTPSSGYWSGSQTRPGQYAGTQDQQIGSEKHGMNMYGTQPAPQYPGHPQYPSARGYPGPQRYTMPPTSSTQQYGQQQQQYASGIGGTSSHLYGAPGSRGYAPHSGAPPYSQPPYGHQQGPHAGDPYYGSQQRPPPGYTNMPGYQQHPGPTDQAYHTHPGKPEATASHSQDQNITGAKTPDTIGGSSNAYHQQSGYYMKPSGNITPQPPRTPSSQPGTAPSPLSVPHPAVSHLRGPPSAPGSPSSGNQNRNNPLSPTPVRPSTPHQQMGSMMKSPSSLSDHSQSPMSVYSHGRHMQQHPYGSQQGVPGPGQNPQQSMMSPPHGMSSYPQNLQQQHFLSNHTGSGSQLMGPPSSATPGPQKSLSQPSTPGTPQSQGSYSGQQQSGYGMQYPGYGYGPQPMMTGYPSQTPPAERRASWQGPAQQQLASQSPQHQMQQGHSLPGQPSTPGQYSSPASQYGEGQASQTPGPGQYTSGHPQYGQGQYAQGQAPPGAPSISQFPDPSMLPSSSAATTISGAAAAAAAAMAAAAHSAKTRSAFPKQVGQSFPAAGQPTTGPPQQMQQSPQRNLPFHPNYANVQTGPPTNPAAQSEGYPQQQPGSSYPAGTPGQMQQPVAGNRTPQHPMQAGAVSQEMGMQYQVRQRGQMLHPHMPPQPGYSQYPMQHPGHPAYGPAGTMPQSGGSYVQPGGTSYDNMQQPFEDSKPKSSSARSASQKLSALYEPDEPGRKDFIDRVLQYWEEKDLPLKHAPLMGRRTLDLFTLYQLVKKKGFMQEVTRAKEWAEISATMGLGNSSTSGFTLKKQYCKYLYGLECRLERGEQEPQEALARVIEANRKKKQAAEQQQAKAAEAQMEQRQEGPPGPMPHHHGQPHPGHPMQYGQYPPGHYPHPQQHPGMPGQMHHPYGNQPSQGHPGQPYPYPAAPGHHGQMPPYGPHQYPPQQHQQYPQPPPRHAGHPQQPGYEQPPTGQAQPPQQQAQPAPQPNPYTSQQRPATVAPPQQEAKQDTPQAPNATQQEKTTPRKPSSEGTVPSVKPATSESPSQEKTSAAPVQTANPEEKQEVSSSAGGRSNSNDADKQVDAFEEDSSTVPASVSPSATSSQDQGSEKPLESAVTTKAPSEGTQDQTADAGSSSGSTAPVVTPPSVTTPSTAATSMPVPAVAVDEPPKPAAQPVTPGPRTALSTPYKPNMVSPQPGQRHPSSMSGNFRPPNQPGQPPYYGGHPPQHYAGPQRYPGQDPYNRQPYAKPGHDMQRMAYPPRGPPGHYPYPSGSPALMRQTPAASQHIHNSQMMPGGPPSRPPHHQQPSPSQSPYRPSSTGSVHSHPQYSVPGSYPSHHGGYPAPPPGGNHYPGMKRPSGSSDVYGPPNKMLRPDMVPPAHYSPGYGRQPSQGQPVYARGGPDMPPGHHYPPGPPGHHPHGPVGHGAGASASTHSPLGAPHPGYPTHMRRQHPSMSPANPASVYSTGRPGTPNSSMKWRPMSGSMEPPRSHSFHQDSASRCLRGLSKTHAMSPHPSSHQRMRIPQPYPPPSNAPRGYRPQPPYRYHPSVKMESASTIFPPGSVETAQPKLMKKRPKTSRDVGVMEAWRVIMSLRSGLLAESTWALNMLTVLLNDQRTIGQIVLSQLPGLLNSVVDHYRCCLKELFCLPEEVQMCCGSVKEEESTCGFKLEQDLELFNVVAKCQENCRKMSTKHGKYLPAPKSLQNPFSKRPVKLVKADDANVMDKSILWDKVFENFPVDDTSHIVATYYQTSEKRRAMMDELVNSKQFTASDDGTRVVEATLEDILSVPSYIRCLEEEDDFLDGVTLGQEDDDCIKKEVCEPEQKECEEVSNVKKEPGSEKVKEDSEEPPLDKTEKNMEVDIKIEPKETRQDASAPETGSNESADKGTSVAEKEHSSTTDSIECKEVKVEVVPSKLEEVDQEEIPLEHKYLHVQSCLKRYSKNCDIVLLQDEPAGCPGDTVVVGRNGRYYGGFGPSPLLSRAHGDHETDLMQRVLCLSNLVRSLSCAGINHAELCRHKGLVKVISGTLLLRHKHKTRPLSTDSLAESKDGVKTEKESTIPSETMEESYKKKHTPERDPGNEADALSAEKPSTDSFVTNSNGNEVSPKTESSDDSNDSNSSDSVFKKPTLENGIDSVHNVGAFNGKTEHADTHEPLVEKSLLARKKNINDLCRKLRSRSGGDGDRMSKDEQKENSITTNGKTKANKNHDTVNNVLSKSPMVKNAMRLINGPNAMDQTDAPLHEADAGMSLTAKLRKNHCKLSYSATEMEDLTESEAMSAIDKNSAQSCDEGLLTTESCKTPMTECSEEGTEEKPLSSVKENRRHLLFSTTVLHSETAEKHKQDVYDDPWWWECAQQVREDSLVTLANLSVYMNLSDLHDDDAALAILDSCLHWVVCPSAEAQDPFSTMGTRASLSPQNLVIEILTKLSMKEANADLILATRPYSRLEKLFSKLVRMVGNRKDQTLREFAIVLLSNLSAAEGTAARAIALQRGAISNLIGFLEECEDTGMNNRRMFPAGQERVNCGTIPYMMQRCAFTLLTLAKISENRPLFLKHQLRLLSLSMSSLLGRVVHPLLSSTLFELSNEVPSGR